MRIRASRVCSNTHLNPAGGVAVFRERGFSASDAFSQWANRLSASGGFQPVTPGPSLAHSGSDIVTMNPALLVRWCRPSRVTGDTIVHKAAGDTIVDKAAGDSPVISCRSARSGSAKRRRRQAAGRQHRTMTNNKLKNKKQIIKHQIKTQINPNKMRNKRIRRLYAANSR